MKENLPFDDMFKNRLGDYDSSVPDDMFDRIMRARESKRPAAAWWKRGGLLLAILALLTASVAGWFYVNMGENTPSEATKTSQSADVAKSIAHTEGGQIGGETAQNHNNKGDNANANTYDKPKNTLVDNTVEKSQITLENSVTQSSKTNRTISTTAASALFKNKKAPQSRPSEAHSKTTDLIAKTSDGIQKTNYNPAIELKSPTISQTTVAQSEDASVRSVRFEAAQFLRIAPKALPIKPMDNPCADPGNGCPTFGASRRKRGMGASHFYVGAYGAPEFAFRSLTATTPGYQALRDARDTTERSWYAFSAGVRASLVFGNGLSVRTGVMYAQNNEIARFDSLGVGEISEQRRIIILPNGSRDTILESITIVDGIFRRTRYNRYRSIDIPVHLGYEMGLNDYWRLGINAGVNVNVSSWRKADIVGLDLKQYNASTDVQNPVFKNQIGISLYGSVALYRALTERLDVMLEPQVRYTLRPITVDAYPVQQKYLNLGLGAGVRWRF